MKSFTLRKCLGLCVRFIGVTAILGSACAFAGEPGGGWRPTYDLVMRWLNFFILVFLIVKFSRVPLAGFFKNRKEQIESEIREYEQQAEQAAEQTREAQKLMDDSKVRLEDIKARIIKAGEKQKAQIIEEARQESRILIEGAKGKIGGQLIQAKNKVKSEMVDAAIAMAMEKLPQVITSDDNQNLIDQYVKTAMKA